MLLEDHQLSVLTQNQDVLMDGMLRHDALPILLLQPVTERIADDNGDIHESTSVRLTMNYITSPVLGKAIELQTHFERILELISPQRQCFCSEEKNRLETLVYGDGTNPGIEIALKEVDTSLDDGKANLENIKAVYGVTDPDKVDAQIESLLAQIDELSKKGPAHEIYAQLLETRVTGLVDFKKVFDENSRIIDSLVYQQKQMKTRLKKAEAELEKWPQNNPLSPTTAEPVLCAKCKRIIPVTLSVIYQDDMALEPISQILFERPWVEIREILPFSQLKTLLTDVYTWAFKPLENLSDPFAKNMAEIMGVVKNRLPVRRRWLRYIMAEVQAQSSSNGNQSS